VNSKVKEPDKSVGGTFKYDKEGNFVEHEPTTKTRAQAAAETAAAEKAAADAESKPGKRGK